MEYFISELQSKDIKFYSKRAVEFLVGRILRNACKTDDSEIMKSSIAKEDIPKFLKAFSERFSYTTNAISGLIKRIQTYGNAMIFSEYPLNWENFEWTDMIGKRMTPEFWQTYETHRQAKDDVFMQTSQYYKEQHLAQSVTRKLIMSYARSFVMYNVMYSYFDAIREENLGQAIRFAAGDYNSFVLQYPPIMASALDDIETSVKALLVRRFGENISITSTII